MIPRAINEESAEKSKDSVPAEGLLSKEDRWMRLGLFAVAGCCILAAVAHSIWPCRVDQTTALFLGFAAAAMVFHQISKFEFFGVKLERLQQVVRAEVKPVTERVDVIEQQGMLPGRSQADEKGRIAVATTPFIAPGGQAANPTLPAAAGDVQIKASSEVRRTRTVGNCRLKSSQPPAAGAQRARSISASHRQTPKNPSRGKYVFICTPPLEDGRNMM
jgi:hypothetical protein